MWNYFFMFLALVAGTFAGMGGALLFLAIDSREKKPKRKDEIQKNATPPNEPIEPEESDDPEVSQSPLTRKIPAKDFSVTDFNCAADGVEADEHINARQQTQDNAYNALKRRKKK